MTYYCSWRCWTPAGAATLTQPWRGSGQPAVTAYLLISAGMENLGQRRVLIKKGSHQTWKIIEIFWHLATLNSFGSSNLGEVSLINFLFYSIRSLFSGQLSAANFQKFIYVFFKDEIASKLTTLSWHRFTQVWIIISNIVILVNITLTKMYLEDVRK